MSPKKVLIVDSDVASRDYLARALVEKQCEVVETSLGKEGLIFTWRDHPDLLIVDPVLTDLTGEELIRKLRSDPRSAAVPAIALSRDPNPDRKYACLGAGFNEYLHKSAGVIPSLMQKLDDLLGLEIAPPPEKNEGGLLIVFLSPKGGTGTSSLCANLAMNVGARKKDSRVALVDMVLPIGSIAQIVGYDGAMNLVTVAALSPERTEASFFKEHLPALSVWHCHLLAGSPNPQSAASLRANRIEQIVSALKSSYDYVLIDIGRALSPISLPLIQQADLVALVIGNDLSTVTLTKTVWEFLRLQGIPAQKMFTVLNRAIGLEGLTKPEIEGRLNLPISAAMPHLGGNFSLANNQHVPFVKKFPQDTATMILREAADQMTLLARRARDGVEGVRHVV